MGVGSYVGLGNETTYGTAVARTKFLLGAIPTVDDKPTRPLIVSDAFRSITPRSATRGMTSAPITIPLEANYIGDEFLYFHLFGAGSVVTTTPGTLAKQHAFTLQRATPPGLSVEIVKDALAYLYPGCKVSKAMSEYAPEGKIVKRTLELLGRDESNPSASSPTFPAFQPIAFDQVVCKIDGSAIEWRSGGWSFDQAIGSGRPQMGSKLMLEPFSGRVMITVKLEVYFDSDARRADLRADTPRKINFLATAAANSIESGHAFTEDWEFPVVRLQTVGDPIAGPEYILQAFEGLAFYDLVNTVEAVKMTLKTTTATVP